MWRLWSCRRQSPWAPERGAAHSAAGKTGAHGGPSVEEEVLTLREVAMRKEREASPLETEQGPAPEAGDSLESPCNTRGPQRPRANSLPLPRDWGTWCTPSGSKHQALQTACSAHEDPRMPAGPQPTWSPWVLHQALSQLPRPADHSGTWCRHKPLPTT